MATARSHLRRGARAVAVAALVVAAAVALAAAGVAVAPAERAARAPRPAPAELEAPAVVPARLHDTGLYAGATGDALAPDVEPFAPQYPLWTDGATKRRWIRLPPGTSIDASDPDAWVFPVGTRLWKEFAFDRRVETRMLERLADGSWRAAVYVWNADGTDAVSTPAGAAIDLGGGRRHDVPSVADCAMCHDARASMVLGFSALQLSPDRDPHAAHAEPPPPGAVDLATLVADGRLVGLPPGFAETPPRIAARTPTERAARGYLHANCGHCHDDLGALATLGMDLRHDLADPAGPAAPPAATTIDRPSHAAPPGLAPPHVRVAPGAPARSVVIARMASRAPADQMPPLGTRVVDDAGVALVARWISELVP